jgi:dihydrofolate reductase
MRKIILRMHISLDGFVAGLNDELDWVIHDEEVWEDGNTMFDTIDTALFGRVTYEVFAGYWPAVATDPASTTHEREFAQWITATPKIVFSTRLDEVAWQNSRVVKDKIAAEISQLKQQAGKDIMLMGSPTLAQLFMQQGWLDEYWLNVNPVVLGQGKALFGGLTHRLPLKLLTARIFNSGVMSVHYATQRS